MRHDVEARGIDVRRFVTFGIIKGFLRRVHRWPILIKERPDSVIDFELPLGRVAEAGGSFESAVMDGSGHGGSQGRSMEQPSQFTGMERVASSNRRLGPNDSSITLRSSRSNDSIGGLGISPKAFSTMSPSFNRSSRNVNAIGLITSSDNIASGSFQSAQITSRGGSLGLLSTSHATTTSMRGPFSNSARQTTPNNPFGQHTTRHGSTSHLSQHSQTSDQGPSRPNNNIFNPINQSGGNANNQPISRRTRRTSLRSGSGQVRTSGEIEAALMEDLKPFLDGNHHADEIQCRFGMSWKALEGYLKKIGDEGGGGEGGSGGETPGIGREGGWSGDYGRIVVVYR